MMNFASIMQGSKDGIVDGILNNIPVNIGSKKI